MMIEQSFEIPPNPFSMTARPEPDACRLGPIAGIPFRLADGRDWCLASPSLRYRPRVTPADPTDPASAEEIELEAVWTYGYGSTVNGMVATLVDRAQRDDPALMVAVFTLALALIRRCHLLTASQAAELFDLSASEAETLAVGLLRMVRGLDPFPQSEEPVTQKDD